MNFGQTNWCRLPNTLPPLTSRRQPHGPAAAYTPFDRIVLTDTFNLRTDRTPFPKEWMPANSKRAERQQRHGTQVIVGNPPWSVGQKERRGRQSQCRLPDLEQRISETYASRYPLGARKMRYVDDDKSTLAINDVTQLRGIPPRSAWLRSERANSPRLANRPLALCRTSRAVSLTTQRLVRRSEELLATIQSIVHVTVETTRIVEQLPSTGASA